MRPEEGGCGCCCCCCCCRRVGAISSVHVPADLPAAVVLGLSFADGSIGPPAPVASNPNVVVVDVAVVVGAEVNTLPAEPSATIPLVRLPRFECVFLIEEEEEADDAEGDIDEAAAAVDDEEVLAAVVATSESLVRCVVRYCSLEGTTDGIAEECDDDDDDDG